MIKILHNPRCRKSREGLAYLESKNVDFEIVDYLNTQPLTKAGLKEIIRKSGLPLDELIRTKDDNYKALVKGRNLEDEKVIDLMLQYPKMIQRPIVITANKAVVAKPPEKMDVLFD